MVNESDAAGGPPALPPDGRKTELWEDESHYRTLVEIGSDYAYYASVSLEGVIKLEWVVGNFEKVTGRTVAEVDAMGGWPQMIAPEDSPIVARVIESFSRNESWTGEIRLVLPDGTRAWTRTAARPMLDDEGRLIGIYGAVQDISDQKRAQLDLEQAESRYRDLVEQVPGVVYVAEQGIRGRWLFVGSKIKAILGYEPEEWLADPNLWFDHVHPEDQDSVLEVDSTLHLEASGVDRTIEYRMLTRDGRVVWVRDAQTFESSGPSDPIVIRGILFDVTREKAAERALLESEHAHGSSSDPGSEIGISSRAKKAGRGTGATRTEPRPGKTSRVLVVDDEEALRKVTRRILEKHGLEVHAVADAAEALAEIEKDPDAYDVVLTDVVMPRMSGIELIKELRRRGHGVRAVYMSGYSTDVIEAQGHPDGPLIEKPFTARDLLEALGDV